VCAFFVGDKMNYIDVILKLANKAKNKKCVPVGAIVVKDNKIVGKGYNKKEITNNPIDHAEIIAIRKAAKKLKSWKLNDCTLYVSMIPCTMCKSVINEVRIKNVKYILDNTKEKYKNEKSNSELNLDKIGEVNSEKVYSEILRDFFALKRKKSRKIVR